MSFQHPEMILKVILILDLGTKTGNILMHLNQPMILGIIQRSMQHDEDMEK